MMNTRAQDLAAKRERLVARAAAQRVALAHQLEPWRDRLAVVDRGIALGRSAGRHPLLFALVAAALVAWRPRRALNWLQFGLMAWRVVRRLRSI